MIDMRNYREIVKAAVAKERQEDKNWSWSVKSVTKTCAKIGWGYLDYLGSKEFFTVEVREDGDDIWVVATIPNGKKVYRTIGPKRWDDYKNVEEAIAGIIHSMAYNAHNTY